MQCVAFRLKIVHHYLGECFNRRLPHVCFEFFLTCFIVFCHSCTRIGSTHGSGMLELGLNTGQAWSGRVGSRVRVIRVGSRFHNLAGRVQFFVNTIYYFWCNLKYDRVRVAHGACPVHEGCWRWVTGAKGEGRSQHRVRKTALLSGYGELSVWSGHGW